MKKPVKKKKYFSVEDFHFDDKSGKLICPAGHEMWLKCIRKETTKARFDSAFGRSIYSKRMGTGEPVFGHIAATKPGEKVIAAGEN